MCPLTLLEVPDRPVELQLSLASNNAVRFGGELLRIDWFAFRAPSSPPQWPPQHAAPLTRCGTSSSYCPVSMACCASQYSPSKFGCLVPVGNLANVSAGCGDGLPEGDTLCCKMGPGEPP